MNKNDVSHDDGESSRRSSMTSTGTGMSTTSDNVLTETDCEPQFNISNNNQVKIKMLPSSRQSQRRTGFNQTFKGSPNDGEIGFSDYEDRRSCSSASGEMTPSANNALANFILAHNISNSTLPVPQINCFDTERGSYSERGGGSGAPEGYCC